MRAKKPILLYCADRELLSSIAFVLPLHRYLVIAVHDSSDSVRLSARRVAACGMFIHAQPGDLAGRLIHRILECASDMQILLVDRAGDLAPVRCADIVIYGRNTTTAYILAARRLLCHGRLGPRARSVT